MDRISTAPTGLVSLSSIVCTGLTVGLPSALTLIDPLVVPGAKPTVPLAGWYAPEAAVAVPSAVA